MTRCGRGRPRASVVAIICVLAAVVGCKREERGFRVSPPSADTIETLRMTELQPGPTTNEVLLLASGTNSASTNADSTNVTNTIITNAGSAKYLTAKAVAYAPVKNEYEHNAQAMNDGKRLFSSFNCVGCHANGGGGMGPALIDDEWIYGSNPEQIFATIVQGRPNGMPSFRGKIPDYQVWQLSAYVRSMSGLVPKDTAPARNDDMNIGLPENSRDKREPKNSSIPKSAELPK
jgi:cytochrome c oxidase cbb3-type subunit III